MARWRRDGAVPQPQYVGRYKIVVVARHIDAGGVTRPSAVPSPLVRGTRSSSLGPACRARRANHARRSSRPPKQHAWKMMATAVGVAHKKEPARRPLLPARHHQPVVVEEEPQPAREETAPVLQPDMMISTKGRMLPLPSQNEPAMHRPRSRSDGQTRRSRRSMAVVHHATDPHRHAEARVAAQRLVGRRQTQQHAVARVVHRVGQAVEAVALASRLARWSAAAPTRRAPARSDLSGRA